MNNPTPMPHTVDVLKPVPPRYGPVRRILEGWKRLEESMDYGPYDYTLDRIQALEIRIAQLERTLAAGHNGSPSSTTEATVHATNHDPG